MDLGKLRGPLHLTKLAFFGSVAVLTCVKIGQLGVPNRHLRSPAAAGRRASSQEEPAQTRNALLADGCTDVYLDVGSNIGVQVRKLYEPGNYEYAKVLPLFDKWFGSPKRRARPSDQSGLCVFGFEANPVHAKRLRSLEAAYQKQGWRVHFFVPVAVSAKSEGNVTFHSNGGSEYGNWGGSVAHTSKANSKDFTVPTFSLADFIETHIKPRALGVHADAGKPPAVVMKMDIEGSEYSVLPELVRRHLMCADVVSLAFFEWHGPKFAPGQTQASIADVQASVRDGRGCPPPQLAPEVSAVDDETYLQDGVPFPQQGVSQQEPPQARSALLADGCTYVYLDVGSNIGAQAQRIFTTGNHRNPFFDYWVRERSYRRTGLCVFGFEANPVHATRLQSLEADYKKKGWRVHFFVPVAVSAKSEGNVTFHSKRKWGGSVAFSVPTFSLADFIETHIKPRALVARAKAQKPPAVVMNMDIEGSEYSVLPELVRRRLLCADVVNEAIIKWQIPALAPGVTEASAADVKASVRDGRGCPPPQLASKIVDMNGMRR